MSRSVAPNRLLLMEPIQGTILFITGLILVVLFLGLWSRVVARNLRGANFHRSLRRFHRSIFAARLLIPIWFGLAVFCFGWSELVTQMVGPISRLPIELPALLIGTLPAFAAWMALAWAQYPADRALREQTVLLAIDDDLPVHPSPSVRTYLTAHLRMQLLFTVVPVVLIVLVRDIGSFLLWRFTDTDLRRGDFDSRAAMWEMAVVFIAIQLVVLFVPEVLRRVLSTTRLPDSPLRSRLEDLCRRTGLKYREILFWRTDNTMGNAAVMGLIPQVRYILLSDTLLETMTDRQIEAVFAHELGHVKHRHMLWYVVLVVTLLFLLAGPGQLISNQLDRLHRPHWLTPDMIGILTTVLTTGGFFVAFGYLSRWFERQADVFAARTLQQMDQGVLAVAMPDANSAAGVFNTSQWNADLAPAVTTKKSSHVGPVGAATFASALHRVAVVNNIPIAARNFTHGSIADRVEYLHRLSSDPTRTLQFDRFMAVLYAGLIMALIVCGAWVMLAMAA